MNTYGCDMALVCEYDCRFIEEDFVINGDLSKPQWKQADLSSPFVDMVTGAPAWLETRVALLWSKKYLYVAYWVSDPEVKAEMRVRDQPVYQENDVELFIAGPDCYYEFQVNALNTVYEVFYIWQDRYQTAGFAEMPQFDLLKNTVDVIGGFQDSIRFNKHPRGRRWAFLEWDFPGMKSAVRVNGHINDTSFRDRGWWVELAFPWQGMKVLAQGRPLPPRKWDTWRMDFSRFQKLEVNDRLISHHPGWSLNPHGVYDSHLPESFSMVRFCGPEKE